jgi:hypothetical protein
LTFDSNCIARYDDGRILWLKYQSVTGNCFSRDFQDGRNIAEFVGSEIITMDELEGFSEDLIDAVQLILSR